MNNATIWQFNAICSLLLLTASLGIVWAWRETLGIGYEQPNLVRDVPLLTYQEAAEPNREVQPAVIIATSTPVATSTSQTNTPETESAALPKEINLDVPFTSQAPEKNWDQPWQDACEEAAVLMLAAYYQEFGLSPLFAKDELLKMVQWQEERGWGRSIEIEKIKTLVDTFVRKGDAASRQARIIENPTVEQIKEFVGNGTPVYVVADGKVLPNPHFRNGGPEYHALIIRGYTEDSFITNDPGTQFGKNFSYKYHDLMQSIRDWNGGAVKTGRRVILVIE